MSETEALSVVSALGDKSSTFGPKTELVGDLILRGLMRTNGIIADTRHVASKVRKVIELSDTPANRGLVTEALRLMAANGIISLSDKRVELLIEPSTDAAATLVTTDRETRRQLNTPTDERSYEELIKSVKLVYRAIQRGAESARSDKSRVDGDGHVAINISGILLAEGIPDSIAEPARYYLKRIGHIMSHKACSDSRVLWWWRIGTEPLNVTSLLEWAGGDKSYEATKGCTRSAKGEPESVRTFTPVSSPTAAPPVLAGLTGPIEQPAPPRATRPPNPSDIPPRRTVVEEPRGGQSNPLAAMVAIVRQLEQQVADLQQQLEQQDADHTKEVKELNAAHAAEIERLTERIAQHGTVSAEAQELIARYGLNGQV